MRAQNITGLLDLMCGGVVRGTENFLHEKLTDGSLVQIRESAVLRDSGSVYQTTCPRLNSIIPLTNCAFKNSYGIVFILK